MHSPHLLHKETQTMACYIQCQNQSEDDKAHIGKDDDLLKENGELDS